jgi:predicted helicase
MKAHVNFYNQQINDLSIARIKTPSLSVDEFKCNDETKIKWSSSLDSYLNRLLSACFETTKIYSSIYRPFFKQHLYFGDKMVHRPGQNLRLFPTPQSENLVIAMIGKGGRRDFSCLMSNCIVDLNSMEAGAQCFPLYYYDTAEDAPKKARGLFDGPIPPGLSHSSFP